MLERPESERSGMTPGEQQPAAAEEFEVVLGVQPPDCAYADAYRALRTAFLALSEREPFQRVLITSGQPSEGKSVVCLNLGSSLARGGKQVLLVDADFRRPALHRVLNIPPGPGLLDACHGRAEPSAVIRPTNVEGLSVVPVGSDVTDAADVASSPQLAGVLDHIGEGFHFVLIDSAPVLSYAASLQLATLADGVLLVSRARTNVGYAHRAISALEEIAARTLGVVVNDILPQDRAERALPYQYYTPDHES